MDFIRFLERKEADQRARGNTERADRLKAAIQQFFL